MKTNKKFLTILTLCIALLLTACGATDAADTDKTKESLTETGTVSTDSSDTALDDLDSCTHPHPFCMLLHIGHIRHICCAQP